MTNTLRTLYRFWSALLFLAVIVQVGLAGYGAFSTDHKADKSDALTHKQFDHAFGPHVALGYLIFLASIVGILLAAGGRLGRQTILRSLGVTVLVFLAIVLAIVGSSAAVVGVFHPIDALLIVALTGLLAHAQWSGREGRRP